MPSEHPSRPSVFVLGQLCFGASGVPLLSLVRSHFSLSEENATAPQLGKAEVDTMVGQHRDAPIGQCATVEKPAHSALGQSLLPHCRPGFFSVS